MSVLPSWSRHQTHSQLSYEHSRDGKTRHSESLYLIVLCFSDYLYQCTQLRKTTEDGLALRMGGKGRQQIEDCNLEDLEDEVLLSKSFPIYVYLEALHKLSNRNMTHSRQND